MTASANTGTFGANVGDLCGTLRNAVNSLTNPSAATLLAGTWNNITASSACNAKLPAPSAGLVCLVRIVHSSTNLFTLNPNGSENVRFGGNTSRIMWAGESAIFVSDGTDWFLIGGVCRPMSCNLEMRGTTQTITADSALHLVTLQTAVNDVTGLMANTGSNRITIQRAGYVTVSEKLVVSGPSDAATVILAVFLNGSEYQSTAESMGAATSARPTFVAQNQVVAAADYWQMYAASTAGNITTFDDSRYYPSLQITEIPPW